MQTTSILGAESKVSYYIHYIHGFIERSFHFSIACLNEKEEDLK